MFIDDKNYILITAEIALKKGDLMHKANLLLFLTVVSSPLASAPAASLNVQVGVGPAWHNFFSYELYNLTTTAQSDSFASTETIDTNFDIMPYVQGKIDGCFAQKFDLCATIGGGTLQHGSAILNEGQSFDFFTLVPFTMFGSYKADIFTVDAHAGFIIDSSNYAFSCKPMIGYVYNKENILLSNYIVPMEYIINNKWQGPYIGLQATQCINTNWMITGLYKGVLGNVFSCFKVNLFNNTNSLFVPSNPALSKRSANMHGNIVEVGIQRLFNKWCAGITINYSGYKNHNQTLATLSDDSIGLVTQATLAKIRWQQIICTIFFECTF